MRPRWINTAIISQSTDVTARKMTRETMGGHRHAMSHHSNSGGDDSLGRHFWRWYTGRVRLPTVYLASEEGLLAFVLVMDDSRKQNDMDRKGTT
mmetsp:Transcript_3/g.6  ORF Transcript_3/g.6 Transcript_3/m.6 type:complete len:94 (+) Transcript_3:496-777(+)